MGGTIAVQFDYLSMDNFYLSVLKTFLRFSENARVLDDSV